MNQPDNIPNEPRDVGPPPRDGLDDLLRAWHKESSDRAADARAKVVRALADAASPDLVEHEHAAGVKEDAVRERRFSLVRRLVMNRYSPIAASILLISALAWFLTPAATSTVRASDVIMAPDGGRLDALDKEGNVLGPCPLKHTDVNVEVSGQFSRVTLSQLYHNPYKNKIEAVYTFPLSHRAAVDRMKMTVGDRIVIGEVHERARARAIYEAAKQSGYVASLLEQERPNIFTQSVANIEPDVDVLVEISYVELLQSKDGTYSFEFPMVVGPRYIPGSMPTAATNVPDKLKPRQGLIRLCPANLSVGKQGEVTQLGTLQTGKLDALLRTAVPIATPDADWWMSGDNEIKPGANADHKPPVEQSSSAADPKSQTSARKSPTLWYEFEAAYPDGSKEKGVLFTDGTGQLNGRWFYTDPKIIKGMGTGFAPDTTQVPDASRITPEPVKPGKRAGHDITISVTLDTGGPGIVDMESALHDIIETKKVQRDDGSPRKVTLELKKEVEIPNRDFVLTWRQTADTIQEATFAHTGKQGKFFTLILQPPARTTDAQAVPRELVFVLDTSGSMQGFPIEKAKEVMTKAIGALRPTDTFNLITFSGDTRILWDKPRPGSKENIAEAQAFLAGRQGSGGTEMMKAIEAALVQHPLGGTPKPLQTEDLMNLPADGREVKVVFEKGEALQPLVRERASSDGRPVKYDEWLRYKNLRCPMMKVLIAGHWLTENAERVLVIDKVDDCSFHEPAAPIRICCFMTDGYVGNDMQIIDAVKKNAKTTRVFSFGIGNSVNRYLLDGMARAGRGEVEYVLLQGNADEAAKRFAQRIQTPVLTDIELAFSDGLKVTDLIPKQLPDLFDVKPLIIHGRYSAPGRGTLTVRGNTGSGRYERAVPIDLPADQPEHDTIATLWARAKVEFLMNQDLGLAQSGNFPAELKQEVINLGEQFQIMTQFTSFVAVEKTRVTVGGQPMLVAVPVEMPQGVSYEGVFGKLTGEATAAAVKKMGIKTPLTIQPLTQSRSEDDPERILRTKREVKFNTPLAPSAQPSASVPRTPGAGPTKTPPRVAPAAMPPAAHGAPQGPASYDFDSGAAGSGSLSASAGRGHAEHLYSDSFGITGGGGMMGGMGMGEGRMGGGYGGYGGASANWFDADGDGVDGFSVRNIRPEEVAQTLNALPSTTRTRGERLPSSIQLGVVEDKLVVKGDARDREMVARLLEQLDAPSATAGTRESNHGDTVVTKDGVMKTYQLEKADAEDVADQLDKMLEDRYGFWDAPTVRAMKYTNSVVISAKPDQLKVAEKYLSTAVKNWVPKTVVVVNQVECGVKPSVLVQFLKSYGGVGTAAPAAVLLRERVALGIAELVADGKIDDAKKLADQLVSLDANYKLGVQMRDTLADAKLAPAERDKRINALGTEARKAIEAFLRDARLRHRLDSRLYRYVTAGASTTKPADLTFVDGAVMVKLLATRIDDAALDAMKKAGLKVEATTKSVNLVVGLAPRDRLADIALLDQVRKVDPAEK